MTTEDNRSPGRSWDSKADEEASRSAAGKFPGWEQLGVIPFGGCSLKVAVSSEPSGPSHP